MDLRTKEAIRYLGYGRHAVDNAVLELIRVSFKELDEIASKRIVYRIFDFQREDNDVLNIEGITIQSKSLSKYLKDCKKVVMLAATLGVQVDMRMRKYSLTDIAKAVTMQACAAAMLEEYLDCWQEENGFWGGRFSPGYGDFSIEHQKEILEILDSAKQIGLSMTDSSMLTPTKSVTAFIGIGGGSKKCESNDCRNCDKTDCDYRRDEGAEEC